MKFLSAKTVIPATAIALGATGVISQPSQAYEVTAYPVDTTPTYEAPVDNSYSSVRNQVSRQTYPGYHYAYYDIARPEYIL
ncbi:MAG: hypothetical protein WCA35_12310 [Kovacikia sp.]